MTAQTAMARAVVPTVAMVAMQNVAHVQAALQHSPCSMKAVPNNVTRAGLARAKPKRPAQAISARKAMHHALTNVHALTRNIMASVPGVSVQRASARSSTRALAKTARKVIAQAIIVAAMTVPAMIVPVQIVLKRIAAAMVIVQASTAVPVKIGPVKIGPVRIGPKVIVPKVIVHAAMKAAAKGLATAMASKSATAQHVTAAALHHEETPALRVLAKALVRKPMATKALAASQQLAASPPAWAVQAHAVAQMSVVVARTPLQVVAVAKT
jgi:hypothetical protein